MAVEASPSYGRTGTRVIHIKRTTRVPIVHSRSLFHVPVLTTRTFKLSDILIGTGVFLVILCFCIVCASASGATTSHTTTVYDYPDHVSEFVEEVNTAAIIHIDEPYNTHVVEEETVIVVD